jgi:soluble lytic murein transglycosylase-like protein
LWPLILAAARRNTIDPYLLAGLVAHESAANTYAIRPEPSFLKRYSIGLAAELQKAYPRLRPQWACAPILLATSYGLGQVLAVVALENGIKLKYPTDLCDPVIGLDAAARILGSHIHRHQGRERDALLRYNGGANQAYPDKVLAWRRYIFSALVAKG